MKLFQDSFLTLPIRLLKFIFKDAAKYYGEVSNSSDAYEHFYTGFIGTVILSDLQRYFKYAWIGVIVLWLLHYLVKEVFVDGHKHIFKKDPSEGEMRNFKVDSITRNAGFIFALPYLIFVLKG